MQRSLIYFGAFLLGLCLLGCGKPPEKGPAQPSDAKTGDAKPQAAPLAVPVAVVLEETVERRVEITGTLAAFEEGMVSVEADGRLTAVRADLGDRVRRGSVLARIADQEYGWRKAQSEADLTAAEADFERAEALSAKNMMPRQQLDESRRRVAAAKAAAELARKKLVDTTLKAPFDGKVARRLVNPGEYVRTGTPAFQIVRVSPLKFKGDVPERYTADVRIGALVEASVEALPGRPLAGKIVRIGPQVLVETRSFPIEAEVENPDESLKPGSFAKLSILTGRSGAVLTIPDTAVTEFAGNPRVFVVEGGKAKERIVELAGRSRDRFIVAKGLGAGDKVIAAGLDLVTDGMPVASR